VLFVSTIIRTVVHADIIKLVEQELPTSPMSRQ
jgi:hypothetical protein